MSKDIHTMNESIYSIAESMKTLVEVKQEIAITNERQEARHLQLKDADKVLHRRVDEVAIRATNLETKCESNTDELLRRKNLEDRFLLVEEKMNSLDLAVILFKNPKVLLATVLGFYILAIKDIRAQLLQSLGIM